MSYFFTNSNFLFFLDWVFYVIRSHYLYGHLVYKWCGAKNSTILQFPLLIIQKKSLFLLLAIKLILRNECRVHVNMFFRRWMHMQMQSIATSVLFRFHDMKNWGQGYKYNYLHKIMDSKAFRIAKIKAIKSSTKKP